MPLPLRGITVFDLSRQLPGPLCSQILADMGARVIRIEHPVKGDPLRYMAGSEQMHPMFQSLNRDKESLSIDLKENRGKELFLRILPRADVLIEGFRAGVLSAMGLDYKRHLKPVHPGLIYCAVTGYGARNVEQDRPGHDINYLALSGLLSMTGSATEGRPVLSGIQIADILAGSLPSAVQILGALYRKKTTGQGACIEVSMQEELFRMGAHLYAAQASRAGPIGPEQFELTGSVPCYRIYRTRCGGFMALGALEEKFWWNFCQAIGREDLVPRQFDNLHEDAALKDAMEQIFLSRTRAEWEAFLKDRETCCEPVRGMREVIENDGRRGRRRFARFSSEDGRTYFGVLPPARRIFRPAPRLGEHTLPLLHEFGVSRDERAALADAGVILAEGEDRPADRDPVPDRPPDNAKTDACDAFSRLPEALKEGIVGKRLAARQVGGIAFGAAASIVIGLVSGTPSSIFMLLQGLIGGACAGVIVRYELDHLIAMLAFGLSNIVLSVMGLAADCLQPHGTIFLAWAIYPLTGSMLSFHVSSRR